MTIPKNINKEHIVKAIQKIDRDGVPERRESTRFTLYYGKSYPPKYVISISNIFANGEEYSPSMFSGGEETNQFLSRLGFTIIESIKNEDGIQKQNERINVPDLESSKRAREYNIYSDKEKDLIVYEYLFKARSHRWLDEHILEIAFDRRTGHESMNILHFIGLKDRHKGLFRGYSIWEAINELERQDSNFSSVIESLHRYSNQIYSVGDYEESYSADEYIEVDSIAKTEPEQVELTETEKAQVIKSRIGQSKFKKALMNMKKKCQLCGVSDERFLIASHIKPWRLSNNNERLDVNNGLLLCPNHDSLFDKGYISFDESGEVIILESLDIATKVFLNINESMKITMSESQQEYMKWHRENALKYNDA
ncbi:HNH endonuclease [Halobacillus ihumii]|uniref:HNH endonuclease n=1 Tax=Halobacillus ihumii TaxID=2686092 RepID=UPI001F07D460|nr:HNH endonuclease signature motif containing protein [Halobacillus ihumii]